MLSSPRRRQSTGEQYLTQSPDMLGDFHQSLGVCIQGIRSTYKGLLSDNRSTSTMSTETFTCTRKIGQRTINRGFQTFQVHYQLWVQLISPHKRDGTVGSFLQFARLICGSCQCLLTDRNILDALKVGANKFTAMGNLTEVIPTITNYWTFSTKTDTELNIERGWST